MIRLSPTTRMARALVASAARHGIAITVREIAERGWSSATFTGWRLTIAVAVAAGDPAAWLAALPEEELPLPGLLVADLIVTAAPPREAILEALVLES